MPKKNNQPNPWLYFSGVGLQMGIIITSSVFLGIWLDENYTDSSKLFTIGLSLLGIFVALAQVITSLKKFK
ncbi:AtpZ/AtpI family protein [Psychroflexus lacisalsi]|jgi:F0F1-type ATP synthase assembly protein I|uniref:F0F1-ATPase subunit Ca2+/Mg2+ transporter n=1 Tax=Psychroflexus lacisalsi TaxID=503928 RepID=A0ABN1K3E7_9FLAO|nr:AtpZ/AtpI family protein [Psychroflexus lacisalsi]MBZ9618757.1 AtpZ/AtpI family protein [Psychroflexus lacisalsi]